MCTPVTGSKGHLVPYRPGMYAQTRRPELPACERCDAHPRPLFFWPPLSYFTPRLKRGRESPKDERPRSGVPSFRDSSSGGRATRAYFTLASRLS
ncbi:hypothetical protein EVAR_94444_1 [Eumeta japonica]|uniref:Uncharacterized protein n=1 Tax=Eumeta variegata TaxID=151549 RepID=A0A4C1TQ79_EUMVA|nr:hypothetical protein EVAR_94444_1 [Eumeta japonica]